MNKAERIAAITASLNEGAVVEGPTLYSDPPKEAAGFNTYVMNVVETGIDEAGEDVILGTDFVFYVKDEGGAGEKTYLPRNSTTNKTDEQHPSGDSLLNKANIYSSPTLRKRTKAAISQAAFDIINDDPGPANQADRLKWAWDALKDVNQYIDIMMHFVSLNATIQAANGKASDNDLQYIVNSNIDNVLTAGVGGGLV